MSDSDYSELLYYIFGELIEEYSDVDFPEIEIDSYVQVINDKRNWRVMKEQGQLVLLEWRGRGPDCWPGHEYAFGWKHKSILRRK